MNERQEIYCHQCGKYVQFVIDMEINGNHILKCPGCGHEHCRVVKNGVITSDRWDSKDDVPIPVSPFSVTYSVASWAATTSSTSSSYSVQSTWAVSGV